MTSAPLGLSSAGPWTRSLLLASGVAQGAGLVLLIVAFTAARQEPTVEGQQGWATLAVVAAILSGAGNGWALLTARRALALRRHRILGSGSSGAVSVPPTAPQTWFTAPGMTRYHLTSCPLLDGKDRRPVPPAGSGATELAPCDWCRP